MNRQALLAVVMNLRGLAYEGMEAYKALHTFLNRVVNILTIDPMEQEPPQSAIDHLITEQTRVFNALLGRVEQAGDALGTDPFN